MKIFLDLQKALASEYCNYFGVWVDIIWSPKQCAPAQFGSEGPKEGRIFLKNRILKSSKKIHKTLKKNYKNLQEIQGNLVLIL